VKERDVRLFLLSSLPLTSHRTPYRLSVGGVERDRPVPQIHGLWSMSRMGRRWRVLNLWQVGVEQFDERKGIDWEWLRMDGAMTTAPLGKKPAPIRLTAGKRTSNGRC